jgi:type IV pilus assembly protein PilE
MLSSTIVRIDRPVIRGFTLIELMIVVTVLAVLALVAIPSYLDSVRKGRRAEAVAALTQVQQAQERWRANRGIYADNDQLTPAPPDGLGIADTTAEGNYQLALSNVSASGYTITATATSTGKQYADSACRKLVMQLAGGNIFYTSVNGADADSTSTARCWVR